jgi:hypothetical protein
MITLLIVDGKERHVVDVRGAVLHWLMRNKLSLCADAVTRDVIAGKDVQCANCSIRIVK